jgi:hypothetical protein
LTGTTEVVESPSQTEGAAMKDSFKRNRVFDPLDLEIIDRVYEAAWAKIEAREPFRDIQRDSERQEGLRKLIFAVASTGHLGAGNHVDFDNLCDEVLENISRVAA